MAEDDAAAKRRARQTVINLLLSLGASLAIVLALVLIVPRDDSNRIQPVDYRSVATDAQTASGKYIVAPELPQGWWANSARYTGNPADGVATYYAGFVGPKNQYIGLDEGFAAVFQREGGGAAGGAGSGSRCGITAVSTGGAGATGPGWIGVERNGAYVVRASAAEPFGPGWALVGGQYDAGHFVYRNRVDNCRGGGWRSVLRIPRA